MQVVDSDLEKDAKGLAEKDGWILKQNFIKYALGTDLCKDDPSQERVFSGKVMMINILSLKICAILPPGLDSSVNCWRYLNFRRSSWIKKQQVEELAVETETEQLRGEKRLYLRKQWIK